MFSDHLSIVDEAPTKSLLLIAAGLVIVCQLVAMVMVAGGQVEKAELREATQATSRAATVWCLESSRGASVKDCGRADASLTGQSAADLTRADPQGFNVVTLVSPY